jgi:hypothetical protein
MNNLERDVKAILARPEDRRGLLSMAEAVKARPVGTGRTSLCLRNIRSFVPKDSVFRSYHFSFAGRIGPISSTLFFQSIRPGDRRPFAIHRLQPWTSTVAFDFFQRLEPFDGIYPAEGLRTRS